MTFIREFSDSHGLNPSTRTVDNAAPDPMRHEVIGLCFSLLDHETIHLNEKYLYETISLSVGLSPTANPYGGFRYGSDRYIHKIEWRTFYDLIVRLWKEFANSAAATSYRGGINKILAAYGVVWELNEDGKLERVLPAAVTLQIDAAIAELKDTRFAPALQLLHAAIDAYNDIPRRDRDVCSNVFDAMESIAKEVYTQPNSTFGQVLTHIRQTNALNLQICEVLERINTLRNKNFGHGMTTPFTLKDAEVDFIYLTCIGAIILFARI